MNIKSNTLKTARYGIFSALIVILSIFDGLISPPNPLNIRLGLSNIVIMYSLFSMGKKDAFFLAILKSFFVLITRGYMAGLLSLTGGLVSLFVMVGLDAFFKEKASFFIISVFGAVFHNAGQILMAAILVSNYNLLYYLLISLAPATAAGVVTGALLKYSLPYLKRIGGS